MSWDRIFKAIIMSVFDYTMTGYVIQSEAGLLLTEKRVDLLILSLGRPKLELLSESWIGFLIENARKFSFIELKHVKSKADYKTFRKLQSYRVILVEQKYCDYYEILPVFDSLENRRSKAFERA